MDNDEIKTIAKGFEATHSAPVPAHEAAEESLRALGQLDNLDGFDAVDFDGVRGMGDQVEFIPTSREFQGVPDIEPGAWQGSLPPAGFFDEARQRLFNAFKMQGYTPRHARDDKKQGPRHLQEGPGPLPWPFGETPSPHDSYEPRHLVNENPQDTYEAFDDFVFFDPLEFDDEFNAQLDADYAEIEAMEAELFTTEDIINQLQGNLNQLRGEIEKHGLEKLQDDDLWSAGDEKAVRPSDLLSDVINDTEQFVASNDIDAHHLAIIMGLMHEVVKMDSVIRKDDSIAGSEARNFFMNCLNPEQIMEVRRLPDSERYGYLKLRNTALRDQEVTRAHHRNVIAYCFGYDDAITMFDAMGGPDIPDKFTSWSELQAIESMGDYSDSVIRARAGMYLESRGFSPWHASQLMQGIDGRTRTESVGGVLGSINTHFLASELERVEDAESRIGTTMITYLYDELGILNIGELSEKQQDRMVRFAAGDPELLARLQQQDVCVILRDATADYNGALGGIYNDFETKDESTLIFEISELVADNQFKKIFRILQEKGINPAAFVFAGHGKPGDIAFGNGNITAFKSTVGENGLATPAAHETPSAELFKAFFSLMKPDQDGQRNIIFASCSQASLYDEKDSTLTLAARVANEMIPGGDVHVYGTEHENNLRNWNGSLHDGFTRTKKEEGKIGDVQDITEVHVGHYGGVFTTSANKAVHLPMFNRTSTLNTTERATYDEVGPDGVISYGDEMTKTVPKEPLAITAAPSKEEQDIWTSI